MSEPLEVRPGLSIPAADLSWRAVRASGPGGQNVNKVATKVELRLDLEGTRALTAEVKERLRRLARGRLGPVGELVLSSQRTRSQERNLADARARLRALVLAALEPPRPRRATRPSRASRALRLENKRRRARTKASRGRPRPDEAR